MCFTKQPHEPSGQTADTMQINETYAIPTVFNTNVGFSDNRSLMYRIVCDADTKILDISVLHQDGSFTDSEISEGAELIRKSVYDWSLHLPFMIPLYDVKNIEDLCGILD